MPDLGQRQGTILRAVVREYIRTGEPVGSKQLVSRFRLGVSSATVRNDMSYLEQLQYLIQPHTSAGRIPTDSGYRFFVDHIENPVRLDAQQQRAVADELAGEPDSLESLLQRASDVLSRITHYAAAVLAPRLTPSRLRRVDLVRMGPRTVMVVLVADSSRVEQRIVALPGDVAADALESAARRLNLDLEGATLDEARRRVSTRTDPSEHDRRLNAAVLDAFDAMLATKERVWITGAANLAAEETFGREALSRLYETLEQQNVVLEMLAGALERPVTVKIGSELAADEMRALSLVMANYGIAGIPLGSVGIIGPTRMDYRRSIATATAVARTLERTLAAFQ